MPTLILASASPRRKALLEQIGIVPVVCPGEADESLPEGSPDAVVTELAARKGRQVADRFVRENRLHKDLFFLGADTIVVKDGHILGKPASSAEAEHMLAFLQGAVHEVYTGVWLMQVPAEGRLPEQGSAQIRSFAACTKVTVAPMDTGEIRKYVATGEPMDKAGAYGIQGLFGRHIRSVCGEYANVVGLPVAEVYRILKEMHFFTE